MGQPNAPGVRQCEQMDKYKQNMLDPGQGSNHCEEVTKKIRGLLKIQLGYLILVIFVSIQKIFVTSLIATLFSCTALF